MFSENENFHMFNHIFKHKCFLDYSVCLQLLPSQGDEEKSCSDNQSKKELCVSKSNEEGKKMRKPRKPFKAPGYVMSTVGEHFPVPTTSRRCAYCSTSQKSRRSSMACSVCKVALCKTCFKPYHTLA